MQDDPRVASPDLSTLGDYYTDHAPTPNPGTENSLNALIRADVTARAWTHRDTIAFVHEGMLAFRREFAAVLRYSATPIVAIERTRNKRVLGTYCQRSGDGLEHRITINPQFAHPRAIPMLFAVCVHEQIHLMQHETDRETASRYHNAEFRKTALALGIPCDENGVFGGMTPVFTAALRRILLSGRFPIEFDEAALLQQLEDLDANPDPVSQLRMIRQYVPQPQEARQSLCAWHCACGQKVWHAAKSELAAQCGQCGSRFQRVAAAAG
ncbi:MAG: hypothetical protein ING77_00475 [Rhodocyclaceae bacterium]|nr:hypothetical protein [Rhodocyclaceae bacterium]MCA3138108.1 hypothetical protein [Rhodocyclaceae bacterium]MCA3149641.1 hypothetical protein [Rhodocyclaceae bacterium]